MEKERTETHRKLILAEAATNRLVIVIETAFELMARSLYGDAANLLKGACSAQEEYERECARIEMEPNA